MNEPATDLSSSEAPPQPNLILNSGRPSKLNSALLGMHLHAHQLDFAVIPRGFQAAIFN